MRIAIVLFLVGTSVSASAEEGEHIVGSDGLLLLPRYSSADATSFAATAFGGRLYAAYGLHDDWAVVARYSMWLHDGEVRDPSLQTGPDGELSVDALRFAGGEGHRGELGARWNAYPGYLLSPYVEFLLGYQWVTFREIEIDSAQHTFAGEDFGQGAMTLAVGASLEHRFSNVVLAGAGVQYTRAFDELYRGDLCITARVSYVWF